MPYDPHAPPERQAANWNCSCASAAWALQSIGIPISEEEVTADMLARGLVTPEYGLMDGSGAGLAEYLRNISGLPVVNRWLSWTDLQGAAGTGPICQGSNSMYHWSAIRCLDDMGETVMMMNPAPGWMGVYDSLAHYAWESWGPWAGCYIAVEEDGVTNEALQAENAALKQQNAELQAALAEERSWGSAMLQHVIIPSTTYLDEALAVQPTGTAPTIQARDLLAANGGRGQ